MCLNAHCRVKFICADLVNIMCDDVISLCLAPPTERFLDSDDDHESEVSQDAQAPQAGQQDGGDSLLLSNTGLRLNYQERPGMNGKFTEEIWKIYIRKRVIRHFRGVLLGQILEN